VLLDWQLTDGDCTSVLLEVKKNRPQTRVLVLTNFDTPEFERACLKLGADQFLSKSRDFVRLPELLRNQMNPENGHHTRAKHV
jgi:DNA-binding NarL/FixJ family response regulator